MNWRLSSRLWLAFGLVLGLLLLITATALNRMQRMDSLNAEVVEQHDRRIAIAQSMMNAVNDISVAVVGAALVVDDADGADLAQRLQDGLARYEAAHREYVAMLGAAAAAAQPALKAVDSVGDDARGRAEEILGQLRSGASGVANTLRSRDPRPLQQRWLDSLGGLVKQETQAGAAKHAQAESEYSGARRVMIVVAGLAFGLAAIAVSLLLRSVTRPLGMAIGHARRIARGDLTGEIVALRADEMGELLGALATMQRQLQTLVGDIRSSARGIALASGEIAQGNLDLSQRTEHAAGDLQATASSIEQLAEMVRRSAAAAGDADALASAAEGAAVQGGYTVGKVVAVMDEIQVGAHKIAEITAVIDSIAFQTNILALNAAVEAAQAGDSGRGFAVVAGEVRNLAQRAAAAGRDIRVLVDGSLASVENGGRLARDAGAAMGHIVDSIKSAAVTICDVSASAARQSSGIEQVNAAVTRLDEMTQRNAALVEQSTAAAQGLEQQSNRLEELVDVFRMHPSE